jgi:hypothetical protein
MAQVLIAVSGSDAYISEDKDTSFPQSDSDYKRDYERTDTGVA